MKKSYSIWCCVVQPTKLPEIAKLPSSMLNSLREFPQGTTAPWSVTAPWNCHDAIVHVDPHVCLLVRRVTVHVIGVEWLVGPTILGCAGKAFEDDAAAHGRHV